MTFSTTIYFECQAGNTQPVWQMIKDDYLGCSVEVRCLTNAVCSGGGGGGGGGSSDANTGLTAGDEFLLVIFLVPFGYVVGGFMYLHYVKKEEGANRIPHRTFWTSIPGLVKDGCAFTWAQFNLRCRGQGGGYGELH